MQAGALKRIVLGPAPTVAEFMAELDAMIIQSAADQAIVSNLNQMIDWASILTSKCQLRPSTLSSHISPFGDLDPSKLYCCRRG